MAFGDEAARGVDDASAAVGDVAGADHEVGLTGGAEAKGVDGDEFVRGEAVVKFADFDVFGGDVGFGEGGASGELRHAEADEVHAAAVKKGGTVCGEGLAGDQDSLGAEVRARGEKGFGHDDGGCAAVGGGAALEFGERGVNHRGDEDLVEGVDGAELGIGVLG